MPKYIERNEYLNKLISFKDTDVIKIITGIRRCGKSTLMEIFQQYLLKNGISEKQIIKINFEDFTYRKLLEPELLHEYIMQNIKPGIMNYIFLDEIQQVKDFPAVLNSLNLRSDIDLYITGSNAYTEVDAADRSVGEHL